MKQAKKSRKHISIIIVMVMIMSLTAVLLVNVGAVNASMTVSSHSVVNNSPALTSIEAGQVWTGKNVSKTGSFGDEPNGQFTVTLSAIGGVAGTGNPIDAAGLTFDDTFTAEYAFVTDNSQMTFYIDGTAHTVALTGSVYQYTEGTGATLIEVTFNPTANTVRYFIGQNALKTIAPGAVSGTEVYNSLAFGVRLKDEVATAGTPYNTNPTSSCTARFNTLQSRSQLVYGTNSNTYKNSVKEEWRPIEIKDEIVAFNAYDVTTLLYIKICIIDDTQGQYYKFSTLGPGGNIVYFEDDSDEDDYVVGLVAGDYSGLENHPADEIRVSDNFRINFHILFGSPKNIHTTELLSGTISQKFMVPVTEFTVVQAPTAIDPTAVVQVGSVTYTGTVSTPESPSWSFTTTSGAVVTLVDKVTLTVTTTSSQMINTTETVPVEQRHDDYGIVTLEAGQVAGASDTEPDTDVKGDAELPQTDGISTSTLLGIFGLALISIGGTTFVICRKKFLS